MLIIYYEPRKFEITFVLFTLFVQILSKTPKFVFSGSEGVTYDIQLIEKKKPKQNHERIISTLVHSLMQCNSLVSLLFSFSFPAYFPPNLLFCSPLSIVLAGEKLKKNYESQNLFLKITDEFLIFYLSLG